MPGRPRPPHHALTRTHRHANSVAVLYIDIDHFKDIDDTHGHAVGDAFLITVADRLRSTFRTEDTIARLGGEDRHDTRSADRLLERTATALAEPYLIGALHITECASVGSATATDTIPTGNPPRPRRRSQVRRQSRPRDQPRGEPGLG